MKRTLFPVETVRNPCKGKRTESVQNRRRIRAADRRVNESLRCRRVRLVGDSRGAIARAARLLGTKYRTYQDWELGTASAPGIALVALDALELLAEFCRAGGDARAELIGLDLVGEKDPIAVKLQELIARARERFEIE